jgi:Tfp pilus assembly protein FimT
MTAQKLSKKGLKGYTLVEVLLVVGLLALLVGILAVLDRGFILKNDIMLAEESVRHSVRRANFLARMGSENSDWSVRLENDRVTVYKGDDYTTRDTAYDETFDFPSSVSFSGVTEITFSRSEGTPDNFGNINLILETGESRVVVINEKGFIE